MTALRHPEPAPTANPAPALRVVLVEDSAMLRGMLCEMLDELRASTFSSVISARTGRGMASSRQPTVPPATASSFTRTAQGVSACSDLLSGLLSALPSG